MCRENMSASPGEPAGVDRTDIRFPVRRMPRRVHPRLGRPAQAIAVQRFARWDVMKTYTDPLTASNAAGRLLSRSGALSHVVSVLPSGA